MPVLLAAVLAAAWQTFAVIAVLVIFVFAGLAQALAIIIRRRNGSNPGGSPDV